MRNALRIAVLLASAAYACGQDSVPAAKKAEQLLDRAARLQSTGQLDAAEKALKEGAALAPADPAFAVGQEYLRQQKVADHLNRGNRLMEQGRRPDAAAQFTAALALDPGNSFAQQRLSDAGGTDPQGAGHTGLQVLPNLDLASEPELAPLPGVQSFDLRGDSRTLWQAIGRAYGLTITFDDAYSANVVRFHLQDVDFPTAALAARKATRSFLVPRGGNELLVAIDSPENRRRLERMSLRTFYLPGAGSPAELQELANLLRTLLDVRFVSIDPAGAMITVRAPRSVLNAAEKILTGLADPRPQVLLDVKAFEVSDTRSRNLGVEIPYQFTAFNLNTELRKLGNIPDLQALLAKAASGQALTPTEQATLATALAAAQAANSLLLQPFAVFGGGLTRTGVVMPPATLHLEMNQSSARSLEHATLITEQGKQATFQVGTRFPVLTASYSPLFQTNIPAGLLRANNAQPLTPSFQYEDLGLTLKATPMISARNDVTLQFELTIKGLAGQSFNGIPTITNREYKGGITLKDGETSVIAGEVSTTESTAMRSLPLIGRIAGLRSVFANPQHQKGGSQVLIVVTPHVVRAPKTAADQVETYLD